MFFTNARQLDLALASTNQSKPDPGVYNQQLWSQCAKRCGTLADRAGQRRIGLFRDRRDLRRRQLIGCVIWLLIW